jgi:hypothetical protein
VIVTDTILKYARDILRVPITETHTSVDYIHGTWMPVIWTSYARCQLFASDESEGEEKVEQVLKRINIKRNANARTFVQHSTNKREVKNIFTIEIVDRNKSICNSEVLSEDEAWLPVLCGCGCHCGYLLACCPYRKYANHIVIA